MFVKRNLLSGGQEGIRSFSLSFVIHKINILMRSIFQRLKIKMTDVTAKKRITVQVSSKNVSAREEPIIHELHTVIVSFFGRTLFEMP